jgi:hypothetical protein
MEPRRKGTNLGSGRSEANSQAATEEGRERTMDNREEADAVEPAGKKGTRWWVVVLVIVLIVVLGLCLWVLVGPAIVSVLSG